MKLYSKTVGAELDVDIMTKEQNGQLLTVIKHASLVDIIYNQLELCKDPECIQYEDAREHSPYPVYKCTIWDKERKRCAVGIGSGKPESLAPGIATDYADESASNRAFDRAAITYLQFPGKNLSDNELDMFLPIDLEAVIDLPSEEEMSMVNEPVPPIKDAPIRTQVEDNFPMNPPVEEAEVETKVEEVPEETLATAAPTTADVASAGAHIITFGKYKNNPKTVAEVCADDLVWVDKCLGIANPNPSIKADIDALRLYRQTIKDPE